MIELEPCPFCGGEAKYHDSSCAEEICEYVSCLKCNAQSPLMYRKGEAVEWWNRRPSPWHTGTPTYRGRYLVSNGYDTSISYFDGKEFAKDFLDFPDVGGIVKWQKIEP